MWGPKKPLQNEKINSTASVRNRALPTEWPPSAGEDSANFCGLMVSCGQHNKPLDYYRDAPHFRRVGEGPEYCLEIPRAKIDYTGAYSVIARNSHGEAKAVISLQIYAKDSDVPPPFLRQTDTHSSPYKEVRLPRCANVSETTPFCRPPRVSQRDLRHGDVFKRPTWRNKRLIRMITTNAFKYHLLFIERRPKYDVPE
uniref:Uncharacterized protein n=1 Tax=Timema monikensis TaxID=170555 RepID=A0A7R9E253_9NEOP|nr:unnamed protein product [Timema monikensis]